MAVTQGHEKISISSLFAATASGRKLPWICLIDRDPSKPIVGLRAPEGCIVSYCKKCNYFLEIKLLEKKLGEFLIIKINFLSDFY
jgi:hypothetical protein